MPKPLTHIITLLISLLITACGAAATVTPTPTATPMPQPTNTPAPRTFDGQQALRYVEEQMAFGPRYPGSEGHAQVRTYMIDQLTTLGWDVEQQLFDYKGLQGMNLIARANVGAGERIILGAHYDTRRFADQSLGRESEPVPGAVDGASGVAVLLEMARTLNLDQIDKEIWLAFFDFEDNGSGGLEDWDWIVGSSYMAENLTEEITAMILVDMIGDADQQLFYENNSTAPLREEIWALAAELGYSEWFIPQTRYTIIDDHIPFLRQSIPAIDIIDFDYPHWHTVEDTADKVSAASLHRVGHTLQTWIEAPAR